MEIVFPESLYDASNVTSRLNWTDDPGGATIMSAASASSIAQADISGLGGEVGLRPLPGTDGLTLPAADVQTLWKGLEGSALLGVFMSSVLTNLTVFIIFYQKPALLTTSNKFVLHLAVLNVLVTALVLPQVLVSAMAGRWLLGDVMCQVAGVLTSLLLIAILLNLLLITLDRFYAIWRPFPYSTTVTSRKAMGCLGALWAVSTVCALPPVLGWGLIHYRPSHRMCTVMWDAPHLVDRSYAFVIICFCFLLPFSVMVVIYIAIYAAARKTTHRAIKRHSLTSDSGNDVTAVQTTLAAAGRRPSLVSLTQLLFPRRRSSMGSRSIFSLCRDDWLAAKTGLVVMTSYAITWLPYFLLVSTEAAGGGDQVPVWVSPLVLILVLFGRVLSPIVYVFRSRVIKDQFCDGKYLKSLICLLGGRTLHPNSTKSALDFPSLLPQHSHIGFTPTESPLEDNSETPQEAIRSILLKSRSFSLPGNASHSVIGTPKSTVKGQFSRTPSSVTFHIGSDV